MSDTEKLEPASQGERQPDHADGEIGEENDPSLNKGGLEPADRDDQACANNSDTKSKEHSTTETLPLAQQETARDDEKEDKDPSSDKDELKLTDSPHDVVRSKAQGQQVTQQVISREEDLKTLGDEQITAVAENSEDTPVELNIKILWTFAVLFAILLVFYFFHYMFKNDATLESKILSGDTTESLRALKELTIQNHDTIYTTMLLILIIILFAGFGFIMFYKDTVKHHSDTKWDVVRKASQALRFKEINIQRLKGDWNSEKSERKKLQKDIGKRLEEIKKLKKENEENLDKISVLEEQKKKKEVQDNLKDRKRDLKKKVNKANEKSKQGMSTTSLQENVIPQQKPEEDGWCNIQ